MREEIRRILKMLEEGRITADEAERLINAIEEREEEETRWPGWGWKGRRGMGGPWGMMKERMRERKREHREEGGASSFDEAISNLVMGVLSTTFKALSQSFRFVPVPGMGELREIFAEIAEGIEKFGPESVDIPQDAYVVKLVEGDVKVSTSPDSDLKPGMYRRKRLVVPPGSNVALFVVDGDISITGDYGEVVAQTVDGSVKVRGKFSRMAVSVVDGDVDVEFSGRGLTVDVRVFSGEILADTPMDDSGRIVLGDGSSLLEGRIVDGDLRVALVSGEAERPHPPHHHPDEPPPPPPPTHHPDEPPPPPPPHHRSEGEE